MKATTRIIQIGTVKIGGGLPVVLQSMTATKTTDTAVRNCNVPPFWDTMTNLSIGEFLCRNIEDCR